jgi:hypothetical protein
LYPGSCIISLDQHEIGATKATSYNNYIKQYEATFKKADIYVEEIGELNDHDDDDYST